MALDLEADRLRADDALRDAPLVENVARLRIVDRRRVPEPHLRRLKAVGAREDDVRGRESAGQLRVVVDGRRNVPDIGLVGAESDRAAVLEFNLASEQVGDPSETKMA